MTKPRTSFSTDSLSLPYINQFAPVSHASFSCSTSDTFVYSFHDVNTAPKMAETCIVCLGDLRNHVADDDPPPEAAEAVSAADASNGDHAKSSTRTNAKRYTINPR